jgi:hypothetical protein
MTTHQLLRDQLMRIWTFRLADRPEHLERVAARRAINGQSQEIDNVIHETRHASGVGISDARR